jgi:diadenosine tetraphosphate (Ap4A) HIT family hydrolase
MAHIYETKYFTVESHPKPFVSREEGGHIRLFPKRKVSDRTKLTPSEATELIWLTIIVGEAMQKGLNNRGIKVVKINYEDLGNWAFKRGEEPLLHIHLFGRAEDAKRQEFPEAVYLPDRSTGFYDDFEPLNEDDIKAIQKEIEALVKTKNWGKQN